MICVTAHHLVKSWYCRRGHCYVNFKKRHFIFLQNVWPFSS